RSSAIQFREVLIERTPENGFSLGDRIMPQHPLTGALREPRLKFTVLYDLKNRRGHFRRIEAYENSCLAIDDELLRPATPGSDYRAPACHCLERGDAQSLLVRWKHEQVERTQMTRQSGGAGKRTNLHAGGETKLAQPSTPSATRSPAD